MIYKRLVETSSSAVYPFVFKVTTTAAEVTTPTTMRPAHVAITRSVLIGIKPTSVQGEG